MSRGNQILAAVLVVQIALAAVFLWPRAASGREGEPLLPGLEADQVVRLTIRDEAGQEVQLAKVTGSWVLASAGDYPCKEEVVPDLMLKIAALETGRLVTQTRASHKRLKVSDATYAQRIEIESAGGETYTLYLGTAPSYGAIHVRAAGRDEVYLASGIASTDVGTNASTWIDTLYFSLTQDQVVGMTLENANGQYIFEKGADGTWTMADLGAEETLSQNNVTALVSRASSVRLLRPLGTTPQDAYGMQEPSAVLVVRTRDEAGTIETHTLHVGTKSAEDNSYVLKSSASPYYVRVAEYTAQDWVEKTREGFLELLPTPTPAS